MSFGKQIKLTSCDKHEIELIMSQILAEYERALFAIVFGSFFEKNLTAIHDIGLVLYFTKKGGLIDSIISR